MTGSGKSMNFPFVKQIRLNQAQMDKFNPKEVRKFLSSSQTTDKAINNQYIVQVIKEMFEKDVIKVYKAKMNEQYKSVLEMI